MLSDKQRDRIRAAFSAGTLRVRSVGPSGVVTWEKILQVCRAEVPWETVHEIETPQGKMVVTAGHRIFTTPTTKKEAQQLKPGETVLGIEGSTPIVANRVVPSRRYMFDLTADKWHNFLLHRSRVVVSNSPDKFYHFRPPEFEGDIGQYNRIFGQIWEDAELLEYLLRSLDWFNMLPPNTGPAVPDLDSLVSAKPQWRTAILWGGIVHACFAMSLNWVADEFDYSIGGVSLSIEKSAKYESLKQNAETQFDKAAEAKQRTVKFIRGLQQPRFGLGVRSAFGPHVGAGILSPRAFIVLPIFLTLGSILHALLGSGLPGVC